MKLLCALTENDGSWLRWETNLTYGIERSSGVLGEENLLMGRVSIGWDACLGVIFLGSWDGWYLQEAGWVHLGWVV